MPLAYGYGRVSTARQEISVDAQHTSCKQFWEYRLKPNGVEWAGWYADAAVSGRIAIKMRPSGKVLLERLEHGDHLIFAKMDRAFRSAIDQALTIDMLLKRGISPHFIDAGVDATTPFGRMTLGILAAVAEFERSRISERMREASEERKRQGLAWAPAKHCMGVRFKRDEAGVRRAYWDQHELLVLREAHLLEESGWNVHQIWRKFMVERRRKDCDPKRVKMGRGEWDYSTIQKGIKKYREWLAKGMLPDYATPDASNSAIQTAPLPLTAMPSQSPKTESKPSST